MYDRVLVGRDREIRAIQGALAAVSRGERTVLMITGEPGIGKTRLLEELVTQAVAAGAAASWGRASEVGQTPPFFPWTALLGALDVPGDPAPALGNLGSHRDRTARLERFAEVVRFLTRRTAHAPVALLFDDMHASDLSSLELLDHAIPALASKKVLVALAARDGDATPDVSAVLGKLQQNAWRLPLARLDESDVRALVGDRADGRRVYELSDGNPLFVEELVAAQHTRGTLGLPPVSSVRGLLRERVARLPQITQRALLAAALIGREFREPVVAQTIGEASPRALLAPACELGLIHRIAADRYRFSHALVAEALADELAATQRSELHLAAAHALEQRAPDDAEAVAHHLLAAGEAAGAAAVSAAERASQLCMRKLAFEDAATFCERALASLELYAPDDRKRRAVLLCARAEALQHATRYTLAAELCDEAAAIVRALPDAGAPDSRELFARIAIARGLEFRFGHSDPLLISLLEEAIERLGGDGPLAQRARLLARVAAAEQPSPDPLATVKKALEAIELAKPLPPRDRLDVMYVATAALIEYVDPETFDRILENTLRLARGIDRWIGVHTRLRACFAAIQRVDRAEFHTRLHAFGVEAAALGLARWERYVPTLEALAAVLDGRFDDDAAATKRFEEISARIGDGGAPFIVDVHRALVSWIRTTPPDPDGRARLLTYVPGRLPVSAWFACQEGSVDGARAALDELAGRLPHDQDLGCMVAVAIAFVGDRALAEDAYAQLLARAGGIVLAAFVGFAVMDLADRVLLLLATVTERWDAVDSHAESARSAARKLGSALWKARVDADYADALERRGRPGDRERARALRADARPIAERFGMTGLLRRLATSGSAAPRPASRAEHAGEVACTRQGALWIVSGFGESVHVKDSRGMQMIARLVAEPASPLHAFDLAGVKGPVDGGDSGPQLDARARLQYRTRLAELVAAREEAEELGDTARVELIHTEIEALSAELERAFGLGGRDRRAGSASERARTNVQRRIAHAMEQIRAASPRIGEHLLASIRTGTYCLYDRKRRPK